MGSRNRFKIAKNLGSQKTESTSVLEFQVVSSSRRKAYIAFEVVFGPRLQRGLDPATVSLRIAALARSNKQVSKQASKKKKRKEKKDEREKTEKKRKRMHRGEPNDLQ